MQNWWWIGVARGKEEETTNILMPRYIVVDGEGMSREVNVILCSECECWQGLIWLGDCSPVYVRCKTASSARVRSFNLASKSFYVHCLVASVIDVVDFCFLQLLQFDLPCDTDWHTHTHASSFLQCECSAGQSWRRPPRTPRPGGYHGVKGTLKGCLLVAKGRIGWRKWRILIERDT